MAVCGALEDFSLLEVLDLVVAKQGWLDVEVSHGRARFGVRDGGVLIGCECSWLPPGTPVDQVVFDVLMQRAGQFVFDLAPVPDLPVLLPAAVLRSVDALAMEWEQHGEIAPTNASVVDLNAEPLRSELVVDQARWKLVRQLVKGPRTVAQLACDMQMSELNVRRMLSDAFTAGLVMVDGDQQAPPPDHSANPFVAVSLETSPTPPMPPVATIDISLPA